MKYQNQNLKQFTKPNTFYGIVPLQGEGLSTNAQAFHASEFADKTVHNMGGGVDQRTGRVNLPGKNWAKFGELSKKCCTEAG